MQTRYGQWDLQHWGQLKMFEQEATMCRLRLVESGTVADRRLAILYTAELAGLATDDALEGQPKPIEARWLRLEQLPEEADRASD